MKKSLGNRFVFSFLMFALLISGCAMKRDVIRVEEKVNRISITQVNMLETITHLDSLLNFETEASLKLRAEIRSSIGELLEQFQMVQANMNDLQDKITYLAESGQRSTLIIPTTTSIDSTDTTTATPIIPGIDCQELYDDSFINIMRSQYEEAIKGFTDYLQYCGTQELADDVRFWIGESYFSLENYREAINEFDHVLKDYPSSEKRPSALYKKARSFEELGQKKDAKSTFQKLIDDYPGTLEAEQAKEKLKEL